MAGLFFGLAFGLGGIGAALLGQLADVTGVQFVFKLCSFLPLIGLLAAFLPHTRAGQTTRREAAKRRGRKSGLSGVLRRLVLEERIAEVVLEIEQELVVLLADVFRELGSLEPRNVPGDRPRLRVRAGIRDRRLVVQRVAVRPADALDGVSSSVCIVPLKFSQVFSLKPVVSTTSVSPSQRPTE